MRVTFVQYGGDYREAWERLAGGGKATYQAQRYSVEFVASLAKRAEQVSVICALTDVPYDVTLNSGVRAIGAGLQPGFDERSLIPLIESTGADRLILVTPMAALLRWAARGRVRTLLTIADSFNGRGLTDALRNRRLGWLINRPNIEWVGNHGIAACLSVASIGVRNEKIVPWDWPPSHRPADHPARTLSTPNVPRLAYVGSISETKGVSDLLRAIEILKRGGWHANLTIVGSDSGDEMHDLAQRLDVLDRVTFAGVIANEDVPTVMRSADAIVIPSRHEYPEGLPLTIYEALAARTPIVASDHPMFFGALTKDKSAVVFRAGDAEALAGAIRRLFNDANLYARLSRNTERAWQALQLPVSWGDLISRWLADDEASREWLRQHALFSGHYAEQIALRTDTDRRWV